MNQSAPNKMVTMQISWKNHALGYLISILLIPLFGIGLIGLYKIWKRQHRERYEITDRQITSVDNQYHRNVDLFSIRGVEVQQNWTQQKFSVGDIHLQISESDMTLYGIEDPYQLKGMLEKAIAAEKKRLREEQKSTEPRKPKFQSGDMVRVDYLTGLWQQGLLSDEEFEKQRNQK